MSVPAGTQVVKVKNYLRGPWFIGSVKQEGPVPVDLRIFPGDRLSPAKKVLQRCTPGPIHGVLDLLNRTGQGFTARGVPLYLFYPLDAAWPPFLVSYKDRTATNLLVTVQYEHWDSGVWPRGGLRKIHGAVGNTEIERQLLIKTYDIGVDIGCDVGMPFPSSLGDRVSVKWDAAFNVDPAGAEDIDDIFAWRRCEDGSEEFMIAIADVSAWIPSDCPIDMRARALGQTLYDNGTVVSPMLPESISTSTASLRCDDVSRPVVGRVYTIRDGAIVEKGWQLHLVKLTACFTYESILTDEDTACQLYNYLKIVCKTQPSAHDSHDWVAQAMITYNHAVAALLSSVGLGVLRRHDGTKISEFEELALKSGVEEIKHMGKSAGQYCIGSASQTSHSGLGLDVYCHASSPLRRYADLVNQRVLKYLVFEQSWTLGTGIIGAEEFVDHLNYRTAAAKTLERELWFLSHVEPDKINAAEGVVLKRKDGVLDRWTVYVPSWRRKMVGVPTVDNSLFAGCRVNVRMYCDLRRPSWSERVVCLLSPIV
jgi:hypothetical protein